MWPVVAAVLHAHVYALGSLRWLHAVGTICAPGEAGLLPQAPCPP